MLGTGSDIGAIPSTGSASWRARGLPTTARELGGEVHRDPRSPRYRETLWRPSAGPSRGSQHVGFPNSDLDADDLSDEEHYRFEQAFKAVNTLTSCGSKRAREMRP